MRLNTRELLEATIVIVTAIAFALSITYFKGCGNVKPKQEIDIPLPPDPSPQVTCGGVIPGNKRRILCEDPKWQGHIEQLCKDDGTWETVDSTCRPPPSECEEDAENKVTFIKDVLPIIGERPEEVNGQKNCIFCHGSIRINEYVQAKKYIDDIIRRINLDDLNPQRMPPPQGGLRPLSYEERAVFADWKADGLIEKDECPDPGEGERLNFNTLDDLETAILKDLEGLDSRGQENARYLVADHKHNLGANAQEKGIYRSGTNKAINALSRIEDDPIPCTPIDNIVGACRIDLEAYDLTADLWQLAVDNADLVLESVTNKGNFIKDLTGAKIPWLTGDQFILATHGVPKVYYEILQIPLHQADYLEQKGVDLAQDFADFRAICAGGLGSPISRNKNRLVCIVESTDGQCSITFDPVDLDGNDLRNLFKNPLVFVGESQFEFAASEILCELPNGEFEVSLWNAQGLRQDEAPVDIVVDVKDPFGAIEIFSSLKCYRCHSRGWIPMRDQIRDHVLRNGATFPRGDVEIVKFLYGTQGALDAQFFGQNDRYARNLSRIGVDTQDPDPINYFGDRFRKDWTVFDVCAFIRLPIDECKQGISQSAVLSAQVGSLLVDGGTISLDQFADQFQNFIDELFLGQEPVNRQ